MAGDWIKMECCTPEKSEVLAVTARLGWDDADLTVGKLFRLWRWFDQHTAGGNAAGVTAALLDRIVGVSGFCEALTQVGWLCISEHGVSLPNFDRHNGNTAKNRAQTAKRVANHKTNVKANGKGNAQPVTTALPREEKRREDSSVTNVTGGDAAKSAADMTKDELWRAGKSLLEGAGIPKAQCGSIVGKLVKDYGDSIVVDAVRAAVLSRPADPVEYLRASCMHAKGQRQSPNKQVAIEQRNQAAVDEWLQQQGVEA